MKKPKLSVFFPAYNEQDNVRPLIKDALGVLPKLSDNFELIIVNDGSKDKTAEIVQTMMSQDSRIRLVNHKTNLGYGAAVWDGLKSSRGDLVFFADGDRQFDLKELKGFLDHANEADVIIGYRCPRRDPAMRLLNAFGWKVLLNIFFGFKVRDVDCAFKLFHQDVLQNIDIRSKGAMFSAELLIAIKKHGYKILEMPVSHFPRQAGNPTGAKLSVVKKAFQELLQVYHRRNSI